MSWRDNDGGYDPHGGRNAFRMSDETSSSERTVRAMQSFTQSVEDDIIGPPELPASLDIDQIETNSMRTSDTNDTIIEIKKKVDPQLGETQKYKMAVPGPGHSEQEQELHKSLIRTGDEEEDAEIEQLFSAPTSLKFSETDPTVEELRHAYDQKIRKRPTTPTSSCVLDGIAFIADQVEPTTKDVSDDAEKIKVSIPSRRRKNENMTYSEFYESMQNQIPGQTKRGSVSGRTTPLNDYEGDILDENPNYKDKAPPAPVVHRRSSIEWENFADMEEKMEEAEKRASAKEEEDNQIEPSNVIEKRAEIEREKVQKENEVEAAKIGKAEKKLAFHAKPPTVEITSPDAPHQGAFHDAQQLKSTTTKVLKEEEEEEEEEPTFSEDMDEERKRMQEGEENDDDEEDESDAVQPSVEISVTTEVSPDMGQETAAGEYDPNAYPGYIWNYETQQWDYDPNYDHSQAQTYDYSQGYDQTAGYDQAQAQYDQTAYGQAQTQAQQNYDQTSYQAQTTYDQTTYNNDQTAYQSYDQSQTAYDYSAYQNADGTYDYAQAQAAYDAAYGEGAYAAAYAAGYDQGEEAAQETAEATTTATGQEEYDYSAYGGYEGYLEACRVYEESLQADAQGTVVEQQQSEAEPVYQPPEPAYQAPMKPMFEQAPVHDPYAWDAPQETTPAPVAKSAEPEPTYETELQPEPELQHVIPSAAPPARPPPARPDAPKKEESAAPPRPPPASTSTPTATRPPPPRPAPVTPKKEEKQEEVVEEDAWAQFKKMTEKVSDLVKNTESTLKNLEETSAANDIKDESYFAQIGGSQGFVNDATQREIQRLNDEKKANKMQKKKLKQQGKKTASPPLDFEQEDAMDRAAQELAMKLASMRTDIGDWQAPVIPEPPAPKTIERTDSASAIPPRKKSSIKDVHQDSGGSLELPAHLVAQHVDSVAPKGDFAPDDPILSAPAWADFETSDPILPPSESGFFSNKDNSNDSGNAAVSSDSQDPFTTASTVTEQKTPTESSIDPFAPQQAALIDESYDPFAVVSVEEVVAMAKAKAEQAAANAENDEDFYNRQSPALSTPTPEGGSPISQRPNRFDDDFKCEPNAGLDTPTPLYDEDDSQPLTDFIAKFSGDGWDLMVRHPIKKKSFMAERCWKPCYVRLHGTTLLVYNDKKDSSPIQELLLQATYSLSDTSLQAYDVFGKIHTVKLQFVVYKEKVGIRPGQISRLVDGHVTKYGLPLEHSAQCTVLLKFGSLNAADLQSFVTSIEDVLFKCAIARTAKPIYKQDEVQIHCYDEYSAFVDKDGCLSDQKARVRLFCLAFLTGSPVLEVGLNDRRRQGKEIVRRKDILPMYTERWIRFENLEFHSIVNRNEFDKEQVISFSPPDGCFFEIMRFRVRPPRNREKAMSVKCIMKIAGSKVEIRIEAMAAAQIQRTRGSDERRQIPCEDIAIRFPIPEAWIYLFREERHWGVGSIHSKKLRPGKVKNLKDRLLGAVQTSEANLIECAIGEAKYEHVYRSLVWRIPRLPEKHHAAYKAHLLKCRFELSSFDLMPEEFLPRCDVDFTMPLATVSNTVVRSVSVEQHEDSDRVEKFVRYVAKYQYKVEIDYVQCANLDLDMADPSANPEVAAAPVPEMHQPTFHPDQNADVQQGYRIDFNEAEMGASRPRDDSSSDDEPDSHKMPIIQIDMKNYGY